MKKPIFFFLLCSSILFQIDSSAQTKYFQGNWTKLGTTYDFQFELTLHVARNNQVKGVFHWTFVQYDENFSPSKDYYESKLGLTAKEYVRGTYDPKTKQYILKGYKKDDPHQIIGLDLYRIKEDGTGNNIGGDTRAHHTWQGRINGKRIQVDQV